MRSRAEKVYRGRVRVDLDLEAALLPRLDRCSVRKARAIPGAG